MGVSITWGKIQIAAVENPLYGHTFSCCARRVQPAEVALRLIGARTLLSDNKSVIELLSAGLSRPQDAVLSLVRINRARLVRLSVMPR